MSEVDEEKSLVALGGVGSFSNSSNSNYGKPPGGNHPENARFDPKWVCVIHINILPDLKVNVARRHFLAAGYPGGDNSWSSNFAKIRDTLLEFNRGNFPQVNTPDVEYYFYGLKDLIFGGPSHVVLYIKNPGVIYGANPLWFTDELYGSIKDIVTGQYIEGPASHNYSFYNLKEKTLNNLDVLPNSPDGVSQSMLYVENHFHLWNFFDGYRRIKRDEAKVYSFNINAKLVSQTFDGRHDIEIPIIIDPDTGNMGGGNPLCIAAFGPNGQD